MRDADFEKAVWAIPCVETAWIPAFGENDTRVCVAVIVVCRACLSFAVIVVRLFLLPSFSSLARESRSSAGNDGTGFPPAGENDSGGGGGSFPPPHGFPPAGENDTHVCVAVIVIVVCMFSFAVIVVCRVSLSFTVIVVIAYVFLLPSFSSLARESRSSVGNNGVGGKPGMRRLARPLLYGLARPEGVEPPTLRSEV